MPTKKVSTVDLSNGAKVSEALREGASEQFKLNVPPMATAEDGTYTLQGLQDFGRAVTGNEVSANEFISALHNRIGKVIFTGKTYVNPLKILKQGMLEYGETIEEIFVKLAEPFKFDQAGSESTLFKRQIPAVETAFHKINFQTYYKTTISQQELQKAFLSFSGLNQLMTRIIDSMVKSANYDEFEVMKYTIGKRLVDVTTEVVNIPTLSKDTAEDVVTAIKKISNDMQFMSTRFNENGVENHAEKVDQFVISTTDFDAVVDVAVMAKAFNLQYVDYLGNNIMIDGFNSINATRVAKLLGDTYIPFSAEELATLAKIPCAIFDRDFCQIYDTLFQAKQVENGEGLYWNYWYHVWKVFSTSPFANLCAFKEA